ncbi:MAG: regulatory protein RecX [Sphingobacteriaceae bacterium]
MENEAPKRRPLSPEKAHAKAQAYCAYQERSQQEVRDKLYDWGLHSTQVEQLISTLIQDNFLNEERFALVFAQGKLRIKGWGRVKIKQALKFKRVPDKLIQKALKSLDYDEYEQKLLAVYNKKERLLSEKDAFKRRYKLQQYLISRGFETDLITEVLKNKNLAR